MSAAPLTRTCSLDDFPACDSVAVWQQSLAIDAYQRWESGETTVEGDVLCYNRGAAHFRAPGVNPIYCTDTDPKWEAVSCSAVFALSVLDRVKWPMRFLRRQATRLLPGGLIVCTFAAWDATGEDCAVGHELRQRIYNCYSWGRLLQEVKSVGLQPFGDVDLRYRGHTLGDHTLATLVMMKRRRL